VLFALISSVGCTRAIESRGVIGERHAWMWGRGARTGSEPSGGLSKELGVRDVAAECNASIEFGLDEGPEPLYNREPAAVSSILSSA
jgi:hypothetical protein